MSETIEAQKTYSRFSLTQRIEHLVLFISSIVLMITGFPQKYRDNAFSQFMLSSPQQTEIIRTLHHVAAWVLLFLMLYHIGKIFTKLFRKQLNGEMLIVWQDIIDAFGMLQYLLFIKKEKPGFGKFNFEQKVTYWVILISYVLMILSGLIILYPIWFTQWLPGGLVPAAKLMHSAEATAATIFIIIWHIYHVHIERLNLSIFTGRLSEKEMKEFHSKEYDRLNRSVKADPGADK